MATRSTVFASRLADKSRDGTRCRGLLGLRRVLAEDGGAAPVGVTFPELTRIRRTW
ncbi:hypothetical protein [Saccharopolyspora sp. ASAGF58]|uniref:hypothetical protein n=1 Tax=Saccharopolyspora sp. ASAGF58 TaxID=2719023 RepID=UPI001445990A|nr:hypothetical protein [Saccharopolyspora sp. ASAGF58]